MDNEIIYVIEYCDSDWVATRDYNSAIVRCLEKYSEFLKNPLNLNTMEKNTIVDDILTLVEQGFIEEFAYIHSLKVC